jgi:hypothetical protein
MIDQIPATNMGYPIIAAIPTDTPGEYAVTAQRTDRDDYITWLWHKDSGFYWGHYGMHRNAALRDMAGRALREDEPI